MQKLYKTIWEIPQKNLMDLAIGRGPYICQSQSLNLYMANPNSQKMSAMQIYAWKNGLKTGQYYFRSRPARDAIKFTVNVDMLLQAADKGQANQILEVLNSDNAEANLARKRKRTEKPVSEQEQKRPIQAPVNVPVKATVAALV